MKKVVVKQSAHHGKKLNVPVDGTVEVSKDGTVEVSDQAARHLLSIPDEFAEHESEQKKSEDTEEGDGLDSLELADLIEIAQKSEYDGEEYKKFLKNKKLMIIFLRKKADEKILSESEEAKSAE